MCERICLRRILLGPAIADEANHPVYVQGAGKNMSPWPGLVGYYTQPRLAATSISNKGSSTHSAPRWGASRNRQSGMVTERVLQNRAPQTA